MRAVPGALAALLLSMLLVPEAFAQAQVPCQPRSDGKVDCTWYPAGDGISGGALVVRDKTTVGYLHQGTNWIVCQQKGGTVDNAAGDKNYWFAWTTADNGEKGWASAIEAQGGDDFGSFANTPDCQGRYGSPPTWSGRWGSPPADPGTPPPAPTPEDRDGDGVPGSADCDDTNSTVKPGGHEIPGNGLDDDCSGGDAPGKLFAIVQNLWDAGRRSTFLRRLQVIDAPPGATVLVSCTGRRCPWKTTALKTDERGRAALPAKLRRRPFRAGSKVTVAIAMPNMIGKVVSYRIRKRRTPRGRTRCLPPGAKSAVAC